MLLTRPFLCSAARCGEPLKNGLSIYLSLPRPSLFQHFRVFKAAESTARHSKWSPSPCPGSEDTVTSHLSSTHSPHYSLMPVAWSATQDGFFFFFSLIELRLEKPPPGKSTAASVSWKLQHKLALSGSLPRWRKNKHTIKHISHFFELDKWEFGSESPPE